MGFGILHRIFVGVGPPARDTPELGTGGDGNARGPRAIGKCKHCIVVSLPVRTYICLPGKPNS